MTVASIVVLLFGVCYLFGSFFAIRRRDGIVTMAGLRSFRNTTLLEMLREVRNTRGNSLKHIDTLLLLFAYLIIMASLGVGLAGIIMGLLRH